MGTWVTWDLVKCRFCLSRSWSLEHTPDSTLLPCCQARWSRIWAVRLYITKCLIMVNDSQKMLAPPSFRAIISFYLTFPGGLKWRYLTPQTPSCPLGMGFHHCHGFPSASLWNLRSSLAIPWTAWVSDVRLVKPNGLFSHVSLSLTFLLHLSPLTISLPLECSPSIVLLADFCFCSHISWSHYSLLIFSAVSPHSL